MGLKDIKIKRSYDSDEDDILLDFYVPALSESVIYKRIAGYFTSESLALAARGLAGFIANNGKMELICGARLSKEDLNAILKAKRTPEKVIEEYALAELERLEVIENEFIRDHTRALAWMVANKRLDIKIAIVINIHESVKQKLGSDHVGIYHPKLGILYDMVGNAISFSGSDNGPETEAGKKRSREFRKNDQPLPCSPETAF